jgi:hypothetical protein
LTEILNETLTLPSPFGQGRGFLTRFQKSIKTAFQFKNDIQCFSSSPSLRERIEVRV